MNDLEISKALALAIGWAPEQVFFYPATGQVDIVVEDEAENIEWAQIFDYRDWAVIGPIAERFDAFPKKLASMEGWWADVFGKDARFADTPQKAIALAVIGAKK